MKQTFEIKELIDLGLIQEANDAIEESLYLGPSNIEMLKLKALLLNQQGKFDDVLKVWQKIKYISPDDEDAENFFELMYLEEREKFYFTDELPGGGRRFMIHPRSLIDSSFMGLLGCFIFLVISNHSIKYHFLKTPLISFLCFALLVLFPWVMIIVNYFKSPSDIKVTSKGIELANRFKKFIISWEEVSEIYIANNIGKNDFSLSLIIVTKDPLSQNLEIDLSYETTLIKGRYFLIKEIAYFFNDIKYIDRTNILLSEARTLTI